MASQDWVEKDFYAILGVSKDASDADIKKAYRKLARKYHPDTNQGDAAAEQKFKDITEAHSVLSDPEERQQYDAIRAMGSGARFSAGGPGGPGAGGFDDVFGNLFGGGRQRADPAAAADSAAARFRRSSPTCSAAAGFGGRRVRQQAPRKGADRTASTSISFAGSINGTTIGLREPNGEVIDVAHSRRHQGRPERARARQGPARPGRQRGPDGQGQRQAAPVLHPRGQQHPHPRAGDLRGGRAGRPDRGSHAHRRDRQGEGPGRNRLGPDAAPEGARGAHRQGAPATCW